MQWGRRTQLRVHLAGTCLLLHVCCHSWQQIPPALPAQLQDLSLLLTLLGESLQQKALTGALWSIHTEGTAAISHIEQNKNEYNWHGMGSMEFVPKPSGAEPSYCANRLHWINKLTDLYQLTSAPLNLMGNYLFSIDFSLLLIITVLSNFTGWFNDQHSLSGLLEMVSVLESKHTGEIQSSFQTNHKPEVTIYYCSAARSTHLPDSLQPFPPPFPHPWLW